MINVRRAEFPLQHVNALRRALAVNDQYAITDACEALKEYVRPSARAYGRRKCDWTSLEQTVLLAIIRAAQAFLSTKGVPLEHLVRVAVKRALLDEKKRNDSREERFELAGIDAEEIYGRSSMATESADSPAEIVAMREETDINARIVQEWLVHRSSREQQVFHLHYVESRSKAETSRLLHLSKAAITNIDATLRASGSAALKDLWANRAWN
jgi:DNA-directed RNA polymerase specialized sigma24 family protein